MSRRDRLSRPLPLAGRLRFRPLPALLATSLCAALLFAAPARAELLVLVHGYLGSAQDWRHSGVVEALAVGGLRDAGVVAAGGGRAPLPAPRRRGARGWQYRVELDSRGSLQRQAQQLRRQLLALRRRHPGEPLSLLGHSAGGVVARLAMVRFTELDVARLISIAAPHLGTDAAEVGLQAAVAARRWLQGWADGLGRLVATDPVLDELVSARPGSFLHLLNRQPHPAADYISIVRIDEPQGGDWLVAPHSQRLESVYALRDLAYSVESRGGHPPQASDAALVLELLDGRRRL